MKTNKTIILAFIACIWTTSLIAQTLKPRQYAVLPREGLTNYKRKDGTYSMPPISAGNIRFTPNGEYLYVLNVEEKEPGRFVVYNVAKKSIEKIFKIPKIGVYFSDNFTFNEDNIYQIAIMTGKNEITVLPDWRNEPDDAFAKKKPANSNRINVKGKAESGIFGFSTDSKSLYLQEYEGDQLKIINLSNGEVAKKVLPNGNKLLYGYYGTPFLGNNEVLIVSQKDKNSTDRTVEIYDIPSAQITRTYTIGKVFGKPGNGYSNPRFLHYSSGLLNLRTGDIDVSATEIRNVLSKEKGYSASVFSVINGYIAYRSYYNRETKYNVTTTTTSNSGLLFLNKNGSKAIVNFPALDTEVPSTGNYSISPNLRYIVFEHRDDKNDANSKWIIATL